MIISIGPHITPCKGVLQKRHSPQRAVPAFTVTVIYVIEREREREREREKEK
jgi:hypothetical protein